MQQLVQSLTKKQNIFIIYKTFYLPNKKMGTCMYCKQKAWFLRNKHKECKKNHNTSIESIKELVEKTFVTTGDFKKVWKEIEKFKKNSHITEEELNDIYLEKYDIAVQQFLYDGILTKEEEKKLIEFKDELHIKKSVLNENWLFEEFMKMLIIKNLAEKKKLPRHLYKTDHDINIEKNENILRLFNDTEAYRGKSSIEKTTKEWFTTTTFEELPATKKWMKYMGKGMLAMSEKHIYFTNANTMVKIIIKNIIGVTPYEDGVGIQTEKDTRTFKNIDGRFSYNIIYNLYK